MPNEEMKMARKTKRDKSVRQGCLKNSAIHGAAMKSSRYTARPISMLNQNTAL